MTRKTITHGVLEQDTFFPENERLTTQEMDAVCDELVASSLAYHQGEVPVRETRFIDGKPFSAWYFKNGRADELYKIVIQPIRSLNLFVAVVPALPGCASASISRNEVLIEIRKQINFWIDTAVKERRKVPISSTEADEAAPAWMIPEHISTSQKISEQDDITFSRT